MDSTTLMSLFLHCSWLEMNPDIHQHILFNSFFFLAYYLDAPPPSELDSEQISGINCKVVATLEVASCSTQEIPRLSVGRVDRTRITLLILGIWNLAKILGTEEGLDVIYPHSALQL